MDIFKTLVTAAFSNPQTTTASLPVPPRAAPVPATAPKFRPAEAPGASPHTKVAPKTRRAQVSTNSTPSLIDGIHRIIVGIDCARTGATNLVNFRVNRYSGKAHFDFISPATPGVGAASPGITYQSSELPFEKVKCVCGASIGPIRCGHHYVCRGRVDEATQYFTCCDWCGKSGPLSGGLKTVSGTEDRGVRSTVAARPGNPGQARLASPSSSRLLLPGSRR
jgi:hypothetical protein